MMLRFARSVTLLAALLLGEYDAVVDVVKAKLQKKEETDAEIHSQEVRARIEALTDYNEGGFEFDEELARLRRQEILLEVDYGLTSVSDPSLGRLDHPQVSVDSIN